MEELYLDANAHVSLNQKALESYISFNNSIASKGHPSSPSSPGRAAATALETARGKIASLIGAKKPGQIIFTSNCTSACTWALQILKNIPGEHKNYVSPTEHPAVKDPFQNFFPDFLELEINKNGKVCGYDLGLDSKVTCLHLQNELGIIQPLESLRCKFLCSDMSQSLGKVPIDVSEMNVDIAMFAGHKFGGYMVGFIYLKDTKLWKPFDYGSRYFMDRSGTPDVAGVVATAVALEEAVSTLEVRTKNMYAFRDVLESGLEQNGFEVIAKDEIRCPNTTFAKTPRPGQGIELLTRKT